MHCQLSLRNGATTDFGKARQVSRLGREESQKRVAFRTFGCKLNQAETAMLAVQFQQRGWSVVRPEADADVVVVNTCAVTARSEAKIRQALRRLAREHPGARVALVGCLTQLRPETLKDFPNVRWILGSDTKFELPDLVESSEAAVEVDTGRRQFHAPVVGNFSPRTRAFLKIQDGCRFRCSYCTVPLARGGSRSAPPELVLRQFERLVEAGYREVVLTGVDIGSYGLDLEPRRSLAWLLRQLGHSASGVRLRLSSVEPTELTDELIEVVAGNPWICRHWHVPLQSGSDRVLRRMRRPYTRARFVERVMRALEPFERVGLGSDVIVGFPGETEQDVEETLAVVRELPFTYVHVFPYSPRPGTAAYSLDDDVPKSVKAERSKRVREVVAQKRSAFLLSLVGTEVEVLVEGRRRGRLWTGLSSEYVRVYLHSGQDLTNRLVRVRVTGPFQDGVRGKLAEDPAEQPAWTKENVAIEI